MLYDEPDIKILKSLVTDKPWLATGHERVDAGRLALLCALAWLAGARGKELGRLRLAHWRPGAHAAVLLTRSEEPDYAGLRRRPRSRLIPALPLLRRAFERRLEDMEGASPDALVLSRSAPWETSPRGFIETSGKIIYAASGKTVDSIIDLADRFRAYLTWSDEDANSVRWAAGFVNREVTLPFSQVSESHDFEPSESYVRALLRRWHPAA